MQAESNAKDQALEKGQVDVVVIDDDESICKGCWIALDGGGYSVAVASNGTEGLRLVEHFHPSVVLVDLKMPGISGEKVLERLSQIDPNIVSVVITGYGTVETAVDAMKLGAFDFLAKPFEPEHLLETVQRAMKLSRLRKKTTVSDVPGERASPIVDKQSLLLQGLEVLGNYFSIGLEKRNLMEHLTYLESEAKYH